MPLFYLNILFGITITIFDLLLGHLPQFLWIPFQLAFSLLFFLALAYSITFDIGRSERPDPINFRHLRNRKVTVAAYAYAIGIAVIQGSLCAFSASCLVSSHAAVVQQTLGGNAIWAFAIGAFFWVVDKRRQFKLRRAAKA
jgi:hypothetical protein